MQLIPLKPAEEYPRLSIALQPTPESRFNPREGIKQFVSLPNKEVEPSHSHKLLQPGPPLDPLHMENSIHIQGEDSPSRESKRESMVNNTPMLQRYAFASQKEAGSDNFENLAKKALLMQHDEIKNQDFEEFQEIKLGEVGLKIRIKPELHQQQVPLYKIQEMFLDKKVVKQGKLNKAKTISSTSYLLHAFRKTDTSEEFMESQTEIQENTFLKYAVVPLIALQLLHGIISLFQLETQPIILRFVLFAFLTAHFFIVRNEYIVPDRHRLFGL